MLKLRRNELVEVADTEGQAGLYIAALLDPQTFERRISRI